MMSALPSAETVMKHNDQQLVPPFALLDGALRFLSQEKVIKTNSFRVKLSPENILWGCCPYLEHVQVLWIYVKGHV